MYIYIFSSETGLKKIKNSNKKLMIFPATPIGMMTYIVRKWKTKYGHSMDGIHVYTGTTAKECLDRADRYISGEISNIKKRARSLAKDKKALNKLKKGK